MSFFVDEFGRPFIILKEQDKKARLQGIEALKVLEYFQPFLIKCRLIFLRQKQLQILWELLLDQKVFEEIVVNIVALLLICQKKKKNRNN